MGRVASIDYGMVRLGIALSDERKIIASSLGALAAEKSSKGTIAKLLEFLAPYSVEKIVVGLPLHMNGKKGLIADEVTHFVSLLQQQTSIPVILWDERLSSVQAEKVLKEGNLRRKKRAQVIDGVAACLILQSYLDSLS